MAKNKGYKMENYQEREGAEMNNPHQEQADSNDRQNLNENESRKTSRRGFASMNPEQQKQIASKGGQAAHKRGVAHQWSADEAREAGRKGGEKVSQNRQHMAEIGRKGGQSSHGGGRKKQQPQNDSNIDSNTQDSQDEMD